MRMVGLHLWAGEEAWWGFFLFVCLKWECPIVLKTSSENQPWPCMSKNSQSGPHLKAWQRSSWKWEGRQWIKPNNRICRDSLGLGFIWIYLMLGGSSWGNFVRVVCEVTCVYFELTRGRWKFQEVGSRKAGPRVFFSRSCVFLKPCSWIHLIMETVSVLAKKLWKEIDVKKAKMSKYGRGKILPSVD